MSLPEALRKRLADEVARRSRRSSFDSEALCFGPQRAFVRSQARRRVACCSRRAGKTLGEAIALLEGALKPPHLPQLYVTLTRGNAKEILWPDLLRLNDEYGLGGVPNLTDLTLAWSSGSAVQLRGANNEREIAKIRGKRFKRAVIDEGQSFPDRILVPLVKDVIRPTLVDSDGDLWISGTPGAAPVGFFWEITGGSLAHGWEQHGWTLRENPHLSTLSGRATEDILREILEEHGWTEDDPTYQREYCGRWVRDENSLVFRWSQANEWDGTLPAGEWRYVLGVDLGFEDSDALAVLAWSQRSPDVYLVEEHVRAKTGVSELGQMVADVWGRYKPVATWVDAGGLGKKIVEELRTRWRVPCEPAEKTRKTEHIALLNDALRTGRLKARRDSRFAEDAMLVQWDADARARGIHRVSERYHSDICDAVLYAYRACRAYLYRPPVEMPPEQAEAQERDRRIKARVAAHAGTWVDKATRKRDVSRLLR